MRRFEIICKFVVFYLSLLALYDLPAVTCENLGGFVDCFFVICKMFLFSNQHCHRAGDHTIAEGGLCIKFGLLPGVFCWTLPEVRKRYLS